MITSSLPFSFVSRMKCAPGIPPNHLMALALMAQPPPARSLLAHRQMDPAASIGDVAASSGAAVENPRRRAVEARCFHNSVSEVGWVTPPDSTPGGVDGQAARMATQRPI